MSDGLCECGCGEPAPIAEKDNRRYGWVKGQPKRFIHGHRIRLPDFQQIRARGIANHITNSRAKWQTLPEDRGHTTLCLIWQGPMMNEGYGKFTIDYEPILAHRWAYEEQNGSIPDGHEIHHLCFQRDCVNADHLEALTRAEHNRIHHGSNR